MTRDIIMNRHQLAAYLGVGKSTVERMIRECAPPYFRVSRFRKSAQQFRGVRFRKSDVDRWIEEQIEKEQCK